MLLYFFHNFYSFKSNLCFFFFLCLKIVSEVEKVAKRTPYSQRFLVLRYLFNIFKLNNAIYMP
jgi:hypothetical protein